MTRHDNGVLDDRGPLKAAHEDYDAVVKLTRDLVRIPSRGGIDPYDPVLDYMAAWLTEHALPCRRLAGPAGTTVALACEITGAGRGPHYVLDACLDTAPFGDENAWTYPPTSGEITGGWLHGRGSSDSKVGAAIFAHVAARLQQTADQWSGSVSLLFDVDEHTGAFGGAKAYFEDQPPTRVDGVMIGYPGLDHVVVGGRGVLRARMHVHGVAGHSGASKTTPSAIAKSAMLISRLHEAPLPGPVSSAFPLAAKLTITAITGGEGYSTVPDLCTFNIDVRLTPALGDQAALDLLRSSATDVDAAWPGTQPTHVEVTTRWPAFALAEQEPLRAALLSAAAAAGLSTSAKVAGPSNIGNYLAGFGVPATAGFGVAYRGLHGTDEQIALESIPPVQATYHHALLMLLNPS
ncbi:M20/M25/M40 family metallo-hydrolase [Acrocarpospora sp. B8E8]|uniref:M20 family metallopeptidase n=1 Tax=Acrocarpospora sp. B8E8 TaxID=3153572 RepID=UPI00325EDF90